MENKRINNGKCQHLLERERQIRESIGFTGVDRTGLIVFVELIAKKNQQMKVSDDNMRTGTLRRDGGNAMHLIATKFFQLRNIMIELRTRVGLQF